MTIELRRFSTVLKFSALATVTAVAGCSGTTYGTGVTQETQLANDIGNLVSFGSKPKKRIDYRARPTLVKAPATATLPAPAETVSADSAYFPSTPEEKRVRLRVQADEADEALARGETLSPELQAAREASITRTKRGEGVGRLGEFESDEDIKRKRAAYVEKHGKPVSPDTVTLKTRKYLTQPPVEYGRPADTAPIGVVGEKEVDPKQLVKKPKQSIWKKIFG